MAQFATLFRDVLPTSVADEFDNLYTRLQGFLNVSFNQDGTLINPPTTQAVPIGTIMPYAGSSITDLNYLLCDGSAISRVAYRDLFSLIGATYGTGDGATTFNIPDLRQKFPLGKAVAGTGSTLGATGGAIDHTHSVPSLSIPSLSVSASGSSSGSGTTSTDGSHSHGGATGASSPGTDSQGSHSHGGGTGVGGDHDHGGVTGSEASHTHSFADAFLVDFGHTKEVGGIDATFGNTTAGTSHNHTISSSGTHSHSIGSDGSHSHTVNSHTHSIGSDGSHSHTVSVSGSASVTGSTSTGATGSGTTGTNNAPFIALNYIIRAKV